MFRHLVLKVRGIFQREANIVQIHSCVIFNYNSRQEELVGELVGHQFVVGATGWAALGLTLMKPEPNHGCVVFFTCREEIRGCRQLREVLSAKFC